MQGNSSGKAAPIPFWSSSVYTIFHKIKNRLELTINISLWKDLSQVWPYMPEYICFTDSIDPTTVLGRFIMR